MFSCQIIAQFMGSNGYALRPTLWFSLRVAFSAMVLAGLIAVPVAYFMARRRFRGKSVVEAVVTVPLVLPPTVVGFGLLVVLGKNGLGALVAWWSGGREAILFTPMAAVIAALVVALPLVYLPAKAAFAGVERELEDVARLQGAGPLGIFWHVSLPLARRGLAAGLLLGFARALGEFGATLMVLGDIPGRTTLPISLYDATTGNDQGQALGAVVALSVISLTVAFIYNRMPLSRQD